jgi:hypothetical protein
MSFHTFLRTIISNAVSQGLEALQQALDLYPQVLHGAYLYDAISSGSVSGVLDNLQAIIATALQNPATFLEESRFISGLPSQPVFNSLSGWRTATTKTKPIETLVISMTKGTSSDCEVVTRAMQH